MHYLIKNRNFDTKYKWITDRKKLDIKPSQIYSHKIGWKFIYIDCFQQHFLQEKPITALLLIIRFPRVHFIL